MRKIRNLRVKKDWKKAKLRTFFFFFFACHFQKTTETFKGSSKREISTGKPLKSRGEKIGKSDFAPLEKFSCYAPGLDEGNLPTIHRAGKLRRRLLGLIFSGMGP